MPASCVIDVRPYFEDPITHDDLLDFHLLLCRDDWFTQLESSVEHLER